MSERVEKIEADYDARLSHARSMFEMAVNRAQVELDIALGVAVEIRNAELAALAQDKPEPVTPTLEDVAMVKRELDQPFAVTRLTEIQP